MHCIGAASFDWRWVLLRNRTRETPRSRGNQYHGPRATAYCTGRQVRAAQSSGPNLLVLDRQVSDMLPRVSYLLQLLKTSSLQNIAIETTTDACRKSLKSRLIGSPYSSCLWKRSRLGSEGHGCMMWRRHKGVYRLGRSARGCNRDASWNMSRFISNLDSLQPKLSPTPVLTRNVMRYPVSTSSDVLFKGA